MKLIEALVGIEKGYETRQEHHTFYIKAKIVSSVQKSQKIGYSLMAFLYGLPSQSEEMDAERFEFAENEQIADRCFKLSSLSLGLNMIGLFYPPLNILTIPILAYITLPFVLDGLYSLIEERRVKMDVIDSIALPGVVITGHFAAASIFYWIYYLSRAMLVQTEDRSKKELTDLFFTQPRHVWILKEGIEVEVPFEEVTLGDVIIIEAGQVIPADGMIVNGEASVDQRVLTGESQPVEKTIGEDVFASTVVLQGKIFLKVEKAGTDTVVGEIGHILNNTADYTMSIQSWGEEVADRAALPTLLLSAIALPIVGHVGALTVLLSCIGDDMRTLAPLSVLSFLRVASNSKILIKDGRALETLNQIDTIVFDKTGTLTEEMPQIGRMISSSNLYNDVDILFYAAAAEQKQAHPIAKAILKEAERQALSLPDIDQAKYELGLGIEVRFGQKVIQVGSRRFMEHCDIEISDQDQKRENRSHEEGHTFIYVAIDGQIGGAIELVPTIRPEAQHIVACLKERGMSLAIISGDHQQATKKLAETVGIESYFAETLPAHKADIVAKLQAEGKKVCFVGDGINDAIALKQAHVSISLHGASNAATDTAQVILMDESLNQLDLLFDLANQLNQNLKVGFSTTVIPSIMGTIGAFTGQIGIIGLTLLYNLFLAVGAGNAVWPLIQSQRTGMIGMNQSSTEKSSPLSAISDSNGAP